MTDYETTAYLSLEKMKVVYAIVAIVLELFLTVV